MNTQSFRGVAHSPIGRRCGLCRPHVLVWTPKFAPDVPQLKGLTPFLSCGGERGTYRCANAEPWPIPHPRPRLARVGRYPQDGRSTRMECAGTFRFVGNPERKRRELTSRASLAEPLSEVPVAMPDDVWVLRCSTCGHKDLFAPRVQGAGSRATSELGLSEVW
jgi:hypothetical protein